MVAALAPAVSTDATLLQRTQQRRQLQKASYHLPGHRTLAPKVGCSYQLLPQKATAKTTPVRCGASLVSRCCGGSASFLRQLCFFFKVAQELKDSRGTPVRCIRRCNELFAASGRYATSAIRCQHMEWMWGRPRMCAVLLGTGSPCENGHLTRTGGSCSSEWWSLPEWAFDPCARAVHWKRWFLPEWEFV